MDKQQTLDNIKAIRILAKRGNGLYYNAFIKTLKSKEPITYFMNVKKEIIEDIDRLCDELESSLSS